MRREPTPAESKLWPALRAKRFQGVKFRHQKVIGDYIADFSSRTPMLVIELDGDTHGLQLAYDAEPTAHLERKGYRVLRYTNSDVMTNLEGVLEQLSLVIDEMRRAPLPSLSPEGKRAIQDDAHISLCPSGERVGERGPHL